MRLQFGTSVIDARGGWHAAFALSAVRADDEFQGNVPSSGSDRLPETVWIEGTRIFLSPRPLQLAGVALTSTGELQAVFAPPLCRPVRRPTNQATCSTANIHIADSTWPAPTPTMREDADVAASVDAVAFPYRQAESRRYDLCAV
jgi:hypothetical protein